MHMIVIICVSTMRAGLMPDTVADDLGAMFEHLKPEMTSRVTVAKGGQLFSTDEATRGFFRLETGLIRLTRHSADGHEVTLHVVRPGETFAEASLFAERYHCDAVADLPSAALLVDKARMLDTLASDPEVARRWIAHLSRQVQTHRTQIALRGLKSAHERVFAFLQTQCTDGSGKLSRPKSASPMKPSIARSLVWSARDGSFAVEIERRWSSDRIGLHEAHEDAILLATKGNDVIALRVRRGHAGRASRHARHRQAADLRALGEKLSDGRSRNMPFDGIAADQPRMAGEEMVGNAGHVLDGIEISQIFGRDFESVCLQMIDPQAAAAAGRRLVDLDGGVGSG